MFYLLYLFFTLLIFIGHKRIDPGAEDTGHLYLFINNLFDGANGNIIKPGKELCSAVTLKSPHWKFCSEALEVLRRMKYETNKSNPSISNWIRTIKCIQLIC